jgi:hypothetical protein
MPNCCKTAKLNVSRSRSPQDLSRYEGAPQRQETQGDSVFLEHLEFPDRLDLSGERAPPGSLDHTAQSHGTKTKRGSEMKPSAWFRHKDNDVDHKSTACPPTRRKNRPHESF